MGSGRDKRKKAKGKVPGHGDEKTARKTELNQTKAERRTARQIEGGEDDLDALLKQFELNDKKSKEIVVLSNAEPPSPRLFASFTPVPSADRTNILMFGGEYYDGKKDKMHVNNDLFLYHPDKNTWTQIMSPHGPAPRSAHQAVVHKRYLYIFGGELTSANQEKFKHYRDLWRLNVDTYAWEQLPARGGPNARSGHRMAVHKDRIVLFGGFHDNGNQTQYYNDLWVYDTEEMSWRSVGKAGSNGPSPRGGSQLAVHADRLFLYGGHTVIVDKADKSELERVHDDLWALDLKTFEWERLKKSGMAPSKRASFGMVTHRDRALLFGGVTDRAGAGDKMYSELHNELYQLDLTSERWRPVAMKLPKAPKVYLAQYLAKGGIDKNSAIYRAATRIQSRYRGYAVRKAYKTYKLGGNISELLYSPATYGIDLSHKDVPRPRARANPMMAVVGNTLWMLGGVVEVAHTDVTLDDMWSLDLTKLNGWRCIKENTEGEEAFVEEGWETDEGDKDSEQEETNGEDEDDESED
ncbi:galactose oxidase [Coccomyxa subellipsoidea C-169]|uniref:Galactose oxidase n=1 Tax=Coccomyxa subellipsoidea (strain C-169) TaxID=574566 RepID=I0Z4T4_COCSC|nr:galactose oxidase [Coccomyxa subellipsoidea C-169]EIE25653.1 galactose oxidase [Coccomyxa subellipsoidea C-169]|eukprot:XP_005650197.1 galactose oxidase [Coccomyxa subellipsoidea C-169]